MHRWISKASKTVYFEQHYSDCNTKVKTVHIEKKINYMNELNSRQRFLLVKG